MSEPGDLNQAAVEEGGTEQESATPENGIVKSESLDEEEKLELQRRLAAQNQERRKSKVGFWRFPTDLISWMSVAYFTLGLNMFATISNGRVWILALLALSPFNGVLLTLLVSLSGSVCFSIRAFRVPIAANVCT